METYMAFHRLNLSVGERASSKAGYPKLSLVVVECIKDFSEAPSTEYVLNHATEFIKIVHHGLIGLATSHLISDCWVEGDSRF